jgi:hypothetical protein
MVPVLSIPALAIFGIPQFAPVVASPLDEGPGRDRERRIGQSVRPADGTFPEDLEDAPSFGSEPTDRRFGAAAGRLGDSVPPLPSSSLSPSSLSGRASGSRNSPFDGTGSRFRNPPGRGADEGATDEYRRSEFGNDPPRSGSNDVPGSESRENPFDSRQSAPPEFRPPKFQRPPASGSDLPRNPRPFHRNPGSLPEAGAEARPTVTESEPLTWTSAVQRLNEMEIHNFRLQPGHRENQFVFICSYSSSDSPRVSRRFEAEADEPLKAVEKVLEQIAEWKQRR